MKHRVVLRSGRGGGLLHDSQTVILREMLAVFAGGDSGGVSAAEGVLFLVSSSHGMYGFVQGLAAYYRKW